MDFIFKTKEGDIVETIDIDSQIEDMDSISLLVHGNSWSAQCSEIIKEYADKCSRDINDGRFDDALQRNFDDLFPRKPQGV